MAEVIAPSARRRGPLSWALLCALWLAVLVSSLAVVKTTHEVRLRTNVLENLRRQASQLQVEWGRYLLEQSTWGAYRRVEKIAREQLHMQVPQIDEVEIIEAEEARE